MPTFTGINHLALTVTDLDRSAAFYTGVLDFLTVLDFGAGRLLLHKHTGFTIGLLRHPGAVGGSFTHLTTGLDHLGLAADSLDDLRDWERRLREAGADVGPIVEEPLSWHLHVRDPDGIALEFTVPRGPYAAALAELRSRDVPDDEVLVRAALLLDRSS